MTASSTAECGNCPHTRNDHRTIGLPCVGGMFDCPCIGFNDADHGVHPDQWTGEGILAMLAANPEPPAWYETPAPSSSVGGTTTSDGDRDA